MYINISEEALSMIMLETAGMLPGVYFMLLVGGKTSLLTKRLVLKTLYLSIL